MELLLSLVHVDKQNRVLHSHHSLHPLHRALNMHAAEEPSWTVVVTIHSHHPSRA